VYFILIPIVVGTILGLYLINNPSSDFINEKSSFTKTELMSNGSPKIGDNDAKISIVEFGDYQCTFCYKFHQNTLSDIQIQYIDSGILNYVYRDFPLNGPDSVLAAEASYCAADQEKYWEYHNLLFDNWAGEKTGWIDKNSLIRFAIETELNIDDFKNCLSSHKYSQKVIDNENYAKKIGINATPSFLIFNDDELIRIIGAQPLEKFQNVIEQLTLR
jgi:protein-disulfide isomerase